MDVRTSTHRLLVRLVTGGRAAGLLAELEDELRTVVAPTRAPRHALAWYRAECRSLAYWYLVRQVRESRLARRLAQTPHPSPRSPVTMLEQTLHDLRHALRLLRLDPGFSMLVIGTLALGIGLNVAVFSIVDAVLVRPLDLAEPDRLVRVWSTAPENGERYLDATIQDFRDFREKSSSLDTVTAFSVARDGLADELGYPTNAVVGRVGGDFMETTGVRARSGRGFSPGEQANGGRVAMLSHRYWLQRYGGSEEVLGSTVRLDEVPYQIVGVMPSEWVYPAHVDVWRPFTVDELGYEDDDRELVVLGRLASTGDVEMASAEVGQIAASAARQRPESNAGIGAWVEPLQTAIVRHMQTPLLMLFGAVGLVLIITCVNTAALWLARGCRLRQEMSVRAALGATRGRMARQTLTEALVLAGLGGLAAVPAGWGLLGVIVAMAPAELPRGAAIHLDGRVLLLCAAVTALTGLLAGLPAAIRASLPDLRRGLVSGAGGSAAGTAGQRALVVAEIALAVVLAIGAGLLLRSFDRLVAVDRGFEPARVLTVGVDIPDSLEDEDPLSLYERIRAGAAALPGVQSASYGRTHPLDPLGINLRALAPRGLPEPVAATVRPVVRMISPEYFATAGIPVLAGRAFATVDDATARGVAIVNDAFARSFYGQQSPLGQTFLLPWRERGPQFEIVGVVGDVIAAVGQDPVPALYFPFAQLPTHGVQLLVRSHGDPVELLASVRAAIWQVDGNLTLDSATTMQQLLDDQAASPRFQSRLVGSFAVIALALASLGIYGVVNLGVARRTRELGIRQALGADRGRIGRIVLSETLLLIAPGLAGGLLAAYALSSLLRSVLYSVAPGDPVATLAVVAVVLTATVLAAWLPARRATRIDPVRALRSD